MTPFIGLRVYIVFPEAICHVPYTNFKIEEGGKLASFINIFYNESPKGSEVTSNRNPQRVKLITSIKKIIAQFFIRHPYIEN